MARFPEPQEQRRPLATALKLWSLVAVQLAVVAIPAMEPMLRWRIPINYWEMLRPLVHLDLGPLLLLAFWCGLGTSSAARRLLGGIAGLSFLAMCEVVVAVVSERYFGFYRSFALPQGWPYVLYPAIFGRLAVLMCVVAGVMLAFRIWVADLQHFHRAQSLHRAKPTQYSLRHLFIATAITAVFFGLDRAAPRSIFGWMPTWAEQGLWLFACLVATLAAMWAMLSSGPWRGRAGLSFVVTLLAGAAYSIAVFGRGVTFPGSLIGLRGLSEIVLPASNFTLSLLIVRSCGYRLVAKRRPDSGA
jgi:hypothetical protein